MYNAASGTDLTDRGRWVNRSAMRYRSLGTHRRQGQPAVPRRHDVRDDGEPDHDDCVRIIHRALDAGINFIDTADVYSAGESEEIVGKALEGPARQRRAGDQAARARWASDPNERGNSRRWIVREVENSLRRLGTDHIDLYQVHRPEPGTDIDDTLSALSDLVHQGKVHYLGSSTFPAEAIVEAQWTARAARATNASGSSSRRTRSSCAASRPIGAADVRAVRDGRHPVEPAERRVPHRSLPPGRSRAADAVARLACPNASILSGPVCSASSR